MGEINTINISALKQYRNDFLNEKSNFKNSTYNAFLSSYARRCNDSYVQKMCQKLESIYKQIDKAYSNIDIWWGSYLENIEGVENTLSENGGSITESVIRSAVSSLPHLMTLKITGLGTQLMNIGMNVKSKASATSSGSKRDFSNIFSGYDNPTDKFMSGGKTYEEVESIMKQQKDMTLKDRLNTATTQAFASLDATTNTLFTENSLTEQEYQVHDAFDASVYQSIQGKKTIIVDAKQYVTDYVYSVHGSSDDSYYQIKFYNVDDSAKDFYGVNNTKIGLSVMCYDNNHNQTKLLAFPVDEDGNIQYDKVVTVLEKKDGKLYQYETSYGSEGLVKNIYQATTIDIMNTYNSIYHAESCYENGQIKSQILDNGIFESYYENGQVKVRKDATGKILKSCYENGQETFHTNDDGSIEEYYADGTIKEIKNADRTVVNPNLNKKVCHTDGTMTVYRVDGYELYDSAGNHIRDYYTDGTIHVEYPSDGSIISYNENGQLDNILYSDNSRNYYYPNGSIKIKQDNIVNGSSTCYRPNGTVHYTYDSNNVTVWYKEDGITIDYTGMPDGTRIYPNS